MTSPQTCPRQNGRGPGPWRRRHGLQMPLLGGRLGGSDGEMGSEERRNDMRICFLYVLLKKYILYYHPPSLSKTLLVVEVVGGTGKYILYRLCMICGFNPATRIALHYRKITYFKWWCDAQHGTRWTIGFSNSEIEFQIKHCIAQDGPWQLPQQPLWAGDPQLQAGDHHRGSQQAGRGGG